MRLLAGAFDQRRAGEFGQPSLAQGVARVGVADARKLVPDIDVRQSQRGLHVVQGRYAGIVEHVADDAAVDMVPEVGEALLEACRELPFGQTGEDRRDVGETRGARELTPDPAPQQRRGPQEVGRDERRQDGED